MRESVLPFARRPFPSVASTEHYFPAPATQTAIETLTRCVGRREGIGLLIGAPGTGKTLVCQLLGRRFKTRRGVVLLDTAPFGSRKELFQAILSELGQRFRDEGEAELRLQLHEHLRDAHAAPEGVALVVDEAHRMSYRLLEELRTLSNLAAGDESRVQLVLAGPPALEERFTSPKLEAFNQRIAVRCYLAPLTREETAEFVRSQLRAAAMPQQPSKIDFEEAALEAVYRASDGIPRIINQVCDQTLMLAAADGCRRVSDRLVEEAWASLQQMPTPWQEPREQSATRDIVEFGSLDDEQDADETVTLKLNRDLVVCEDPDPLERLEEIERHLGSMDAQQRKPALRPNFTATTAAAGIGIGAQSEDPFGEAFDDDEVVLDRCASFDEGLWSTRLRVSSREGRTLSTLLEPFLHVAEGATFTITAGSGPALAIPDPLPDEHAAAAADDFDSVLEEPGFAVRETTVMSSMPPRPITRIAVRAPATHAGEAPALVQSADENEPPMIVIEDDKTLEVVVPRSTRPVAHRQEYGQLFARLRRG